MKKVLMVGKMIIPSFMELLVAHLFLDLGFFDLFDCPGRILTQELQSHLEVVGACIIDHL